MSPVCLLHLRFSLELDCVFSRNLSIPQGVGVVSTSWVDLWPLVSPFFVLVIMRYVVGVAEFSPLLPTPSALKLEKSIF